MTTVMPHVNDPSVTKHAGMSKVFKMNPFFPYFFGPICLVSTLDDLGAKAMGNGQSRESSDVPWQARAKDLKTHPLVCSKETVSVRKVGGILFPNQKLPQLAEASNAPLRLE